MNIVVEGPDGSGKSTLIAAFKERFDLLHHTAPRGRTGQKFAGWTAQHSGGPAKSADEIEERAREYLTRDRTLFDRHPCVSNPIYSTIFHGIGGPSADLIAQFYLTRPLIIYCRAVDLSRHVVKEDDLAKEFLERISLDYGRLVNLYDIWAVEHANLIFRIGEDTRAFVSSIYSRLF